MNAFYSEWGRMQYFRVMSAFIWGIIIGVLGNMVTGILAALLARRHLKSLWESFRAFCLFYRKFSSLGMIRFNRDREDYKGTRADGIAKYISSAKRSVKIVGINLRTGIESDGIIPTVESMVTSSHSPVDFTISLLDPDNHMTMFAIAKVQDKTESELASSISSTLRNLLELKARLPKESSSRLVIKAHQVLPFASAIIIDAEDPRSGEIQLETKPYREPLKCSFGFTLRAGGSHSLYKTLLESYSKLVNDGRMLNKTSDVRCIGKTNR